MNLFKIIILIALTCNLSYSQNTDSVQYYELEPTIFSEKVGGIQYNTMNFFSKRQNISTRMNSYYPIGNMYPYTNNYGVKLVLPKNDAYFFLKKATFYIDDIERMMMDSINFYVVIKKSNGTLEKQLLRTINRSFIQSTKETKHNGKLLEISFEAVEIAYNSKEEYYFFKEIPKNQEKINAIFIVNQRKGSAYYIHNETILPLSLKFEAEKSTEIKHPMWQVRLLYNSYNKAEN